MIKGVRCAACWLACGLTLSATGTGSQNPRQSTRGETLINIDVVPVPTTVLDKRGRFVSGLKKEDFRVREDGVVQELTSFSVEESAIRVTLLLDVSGSMQDRIDAVKRAATEFIRHVGPKDLIKVIQFDHAYKPLSGFSSDTAQLRDAIALAKTEGGATALHNALSRALAEMEANKARDAGEKRHRAIILLTDGDDTVSALTADEVVLMARGGDALIYSLSLDRQNGRPYKDGPSSIMLRQLADLTGGDLQFPDILNLGRHYRDLSEQLRQQYMLGYLSSNTSTRPGYRAIQVEVNRKNVNLRYRQGYQVGRVLK